jgi:hypothetical protein
VEAHAAGSAVVPSERSSTRKQKFSVDATSPRGARRSRSSPRRRSGSRIAEKALGPGERIARGRGRSKRMRELAGVGVGGSEDARTGARKRRRRRRKERRLRLLSRGLIRDREPSISA